MLVAISGSQGSGKSTILNEIKKLGYNTIERKTSRSILEEWGVTLQEVNENPTLTTKFQDEIIARKNADEALALFAARPLKSEVLFFTERTYADLFTYSLVSLGVHNTYSKWLDEYYEKCMRYNQSYGLVYYLRAGQFNVVHDGVRGSNKHYSRMVDLTMLDFTKQMTHNSKLTVIETPDLEQRVNIITLQARSLTKSR